MALSTRYIGTCAFCWQNIRCPSGTLALHGFKRPGVGYTIGKCPGARKEPWEVSPITGQIALDYYTADVKNLKARLARLPTETELTPRWGRNPKPLRKDEAKPYEWLALYESIETEAKNNLRYSERFRAEYEVKVREWESTKVKTLEEDVQEKREKAEANKRERLDRYTENRDKTVAHIKKAFDKVLKGEAFLKTATDPDKIVKVLIETCKAAESLYSKFTDKPYTLEQNYPGLVDRSFVLADMNLDDIFKHMGLIDGADYLKPSESRKLQYLQTGKYESSYLRDGLDYWKPTWPGWKGIIRYPEGSTGIRDRHGW
jgi:hypothetical protein